MQEGPIDIDQYEYVTGAQIRMQNAIDEVKDALEGNMYIGKQRSSQTIKIIGDPGKMNQIYRDMLRETTQDVLSEMKRNGEMYHGAAIQYMGRYLWKLEDRTPEKDSRIWDMFQGRPQEYFTSIRIRDAAVSVGKELKK